MKITHAQAEAKQKFGVDMWVYNTGTKAVGFVYDEVHSGHFEEFYHTSSTFLYYVLEGSGTFFLNGEPSTVEAGDVIVATPMTKIYYLGEMKVLLVTTPAWNAKDEVHVRDIPRNNR